MTENTTYDQLKTQRHLSLEWRGINSTQICFEKSCFSFKKDHVTYTIEIAVIGDEKKISISVDTPTTFEKIYHYLGDIKRYEYLVDGAFYCMKKCETNVLTFSEEIPSEVIMFLDPTIEKLHFDENENKTLIHLKFKDKEEILLNNPVELNNYLSSGTVKGMIIFTLAQEVLQSGGYMVIDEVENHFNKENVITLIRFFMDSKLNKNGGTLIFSTHYPELLDEYDRNDSIFITRNRNGITVENLSNILKRNDIKKSDAYQSGFLEGTTPTYEAYMRLKKSIALALM